MMKMRLLSELHQPMHKSWNSFFNDEVLSLLQNIEMELIENEHLVTPSFNRVLHFCTLNLNTIKVIILGQDPYPQSGVATGRAFEVGTLKSWNETFRNTSLKNIVRSIYKVEKGDVKTFNEIKKELVPDLFSTGFKLLEPDLLFKYWEEQGVLLLNTSFTCEIGKPGSHESIWREFTLALLKFINSVNPSLIWLLWGNHAKSIVADININNKIENAHPMICSEREGDFLFGSVNPFNETAELIDWSGKEKAGY